MQKFIVQQILGIHECNNLSFNKFGAEMSERIYCSINLLSLQDKAVLACIHRGFCLHQRQNALKVKSHVHAKLDSSASPSMAQCLQGSN